MLTVCLPLLTITLSVCYFWKCFLYAECPITNSGDPGPNNAWCCLRLPSCHPTSLQGDMEAACCLLNPLKALEGWKKITFFTKETRSDVLMSSKRSSEGRKWGAFTAVRNPSKGLKTFGFLCENGSDFFLPLKASTRPSEGCPPNPQNAFGWKAWGGAGVCALWARWHHDSASQPGAQSICPLCPLWYAAVKGNHQWLYLKYCNVIIFKKIVFV